ncbi:hypothetical protein Ddye_023025 [Dipteronia dyeriana]|uniref:Uncharacterized protein n=1 Tax=Dipteronia dyeriana TaxID=168575 RepID=A0AAD9TSM5_9ROSI|nr:hypothetical protein Ddye_023025 [Dipteronia dyeriana]
MEEHKKDYLNDFLCHRTRTIFGEFVKLVKDNEAREHDCYAVTIALGSDDFVKMVLVDSIFLIEFLLRYGGGGGVHQFKANFNFNQWLIIYIMHEICFLENQLPFFILHELFDLARVYVNEKRVSLIDLIYVFFKSTYEVSSKIKHFVDLINKNSKM